MIESHSFNAFIMALGWTLIHSLWIGLVISSILYFVLKGTSNPSLKHDISLAAYGLFSVLLIGLFFQLFKIEESFHINHVSSLNLAGELQSMIGMESSRTYHFWLREMNYIHWLVGIWMLGVFVMSVKWFLGFLYIIKMKRQALDLIPKSWNQKALQLINEFQIKRKVSLSASDLITSPVVVGTIKPIILFPIALINKLNMSDVEHILIHELIHIKRKDYLINGLIRLIHCFLYFNPFSWYIINLMEENREYACDDQAIANTLNHDYIHTLIKIKSLEMKNNKSALPVMSFASSSKSNLLGRVKRMLNQPTELTRFPIMTTLLFIFGIGLVFLFIRADYPVFNHPVQIDQLEVIDPLDQSEAVIKSPVNRKVENLDTKHMLPSHNNGQTFLSLSPDQDTLPKKSKGLTHIKRTDEDGTIELYMNNDEITQLFIDGQEIDPSEYEKYEDLINPLRDHKDMPEYRFKHFDVPHFVIPEIQMPDEFLADSISDHIAQQMEEWSHHWEENMHSFEKLDSFNFDFPKMNEFKFEFDQMNDEYLKELDEKLKGFEHEFNFHFKNDLDWSEQMEDFQMDMEDFQMDQTELKEMMQSLKESIMEMEQKIYQRNMESEQELKRHLEEKEQKEKSNIQEF